jgi:glycine cleavage system H protein
VVESVKAASDIYSPVSGEVVAVNGELDNAPQKINEGAYDAWMFRLRPANASELEDLLDAVGYQKIVEAQAH